jgi:putative transposase
MTYQGNCTLPEDLLAKIAEQGLEYLPELVRILVDSAMLAERQDYLQAKPYQRTPNRRGQANGFKPKTVVTRIGAIPFSVPQVRDGGFYPQALEKGIRSERALVLSLAEMYVQGVSTRKVAEITERLIGKAVSSSQVSRAAAELDTILESWRNQPIGEMVYLLLDARYEKVRQGGQVRDVAILIAVGIDSEGKRRILGISVSLGEHEVHWREFLKSLVARGLCGVRLIVSDDHQGLRAARQGVFGGVPWQRCNFHLQQNAMAYAPRQAMRVVIARDIRTVLQAADRGMAEANLKLIVQKYSKRIPRLSAWMEANLPEGLTVMEFPESHRRLLRTTNMIERLNREIRRRTRVVTIFPNVASCQRLISAILMEVDEEWQMGKRYLTFPKPEEEQTT